MQILRHNFSVLHLENSGSCNTFFCRIPPTKRVHSISVTMETTRDLGSGSHSHDSGDHGKNNKRSYYSSNSTNTYFVACDLCSNGEYPSKPRKKVSSWPTVRCRDIYNDLQSLNKHANPTQCYNQTYQYRDLCCDTNTQTSVARQSSVSSNSSSSLPLPRFSTIFAVFIIWFVAREYVKSRRRMLDGEGDIDDSSIPPEEGTEYKKMGSEGIDKEVPQKLMKLGSKPLRSKRSTSINRGRSKRDDSEDDDSDASPVLSFIQMLLSTPPNRQKNRRQRRGRSRRRSRSRSVSRSRSRRRTKRPIIPAEPDPPQMQLV